MANCETCKNKTATLDSVPYIVHESSMARMERTIKRLWITILLLVGASCALIWYDAQFEVVEKTTIEAEQDGSGVNIVSGGDLDYGTESADNQN